MHSPVPRDKILGVFAIEDNTVRIDKKSFTDWVFEHHQEPYTKLVDVLRKQGCHERRASVSTGVPNVIHTRIPVLDIPIDAATFADFIEGAPDHTSADENAS